MSAVWKFKRENLNINDKWTVIPIVNKDDMYVLTAGDREVLLQFNKPHQLKYYLLKDNRERFALTCNEYDSHSVSHILNDWDGGVVWVHIDKKLKV